MSECHWGQNEQSSFVPAKPCVAIAIVLCAVALLCIAWFVQHGLSRHLYWTSQLDLFIYLNQLCSGNPGLWLNLTQLGDAVFLLPLLSFFIITHPKIWVAFFASIPLAVVLTHGAKALAAVPRPAAVLDAQSINVIGEHLTSHNSLPSGHTATVFVVGTVIMLSLFFAQHHRYRWFVLMFFLVVTSILAFSRVAVGAHWPLDVFFGSLCGYTGGLSGIYITQQHTRWWKWITLPRFQLVPGFILLFWSASLLPYFGTSPNDAALVHWLAALVGMCSALFLIAAYFKYNKTLCENARLLLQTKNPLLAVNSYERKSH